MQIAQYKNLGNVSILEVSGSLTKISSNENEFWVPSSKLKPAKFAKKKGETTKVDTVEFVNMGPAYMGVDLAHGSDKTAINGVVIESADPLVELLKRNGCYISAKVPGPYWNKFVANVLERTGHEPNRCAACVLAEGSKSWGYTLTVNVRVAPAEKTLLPTNATKCNKGVNVYRFHGNALIMDLLAQGFKFGKNKPLTN